ncbi:MAG: LysE family translocator [Burkholderiaceae bacterium]
MIDPGAWWLFIAATIAVVIVPGPTVTVIIANSLRAGTRAGLANVAGTQVGIALMILVLAAGFAQVVEHLGVVFDVLRLFGAAYLVWLGVRMWRADGSLIQDGGPMMPSNPLDRGTWAYFWQGFVVIWSNPKALVFFGAFIPQFVDAAAPAGPQVVLLGATFMTVATVLDSAYAVAAGRMRSLLSRRRVRLLERISGTCLIGGGIWLALTRR